MRHGVASAHRGIGSCGTASGITIALVLIHVAALGTMKRTINSIATGSRIGSGKRIGKRRRTRCQQGKERCYCQKLSRNVPESHDVLSRVYYPGKLRYSRFRSFMQHCAKKMRRAS